MKTRGRDLGLPFEGVPGPNNAITDVPSVGVGFRTLISGDNVRTGVTAILPHLPGERPRGVRAGLHSFNGNGEMTGAHWIRDAGYFDSPVLITNTHSVGTVHQAVTEWMLEQYASHYAEQHRFVLPVVAETYDGILNDINRPSITREDVFAALESISYESIDEGNVGGGTGMIAYELKAGTGTSSREVRIGSRGFIVGVLVQANFGLRDDLRILGVPIGKRLQDHRLNGVTEDRELGSVIAVVATNCPLSAVQLQRVAKRATVGVSRTGTIGGNSSGDIFLAFSNDSCVAGSRHLAHIDDNEIDAVYRATVESVEEAVINSLVAATSLNTFRPGGLLASALPHDLLRDAFRGIGGAV